MYKILAVDDEENIRKLLIKYGEFEGHTVIEAKNGMHAIEIALKEEIDIIIMDVMMPELDGFSAVKEIRKTKDTPVIMLSARGEEYDKIHGFELGIDDYVVKPFSPKEVMMRIDAIMKRTESTKLKDEQIIQRDIFESENFKVDFTARRVYINDEEIHLSPKEYDLLFYMVKRPNVALTRENILEEVWGYDFFGDDRTLDTHIKQLRKSLQKQKKRIVTLRGIGYRFEGII